MSNADLGLKHPADDWSRATALAGQDALRGDRRGWRAILPLIGPAIVASIAYMDPGNIATNVQAGSQFGYLLLWVVVLANAIGILFQIMAAKLGIVTGQSLAAQCRAHFPPRVVYGMWIASEIAAMATDLAEFLGAAIGLSLLFGLPTMVSLVLVGLGTYAVLVLQGQGFRLAEILIGAGVLIIGLSYMIELVIAPVDWAKLGLGLVTPRLNGSESVLLAVGIVGATVMPHAIYLHSSLTGGRIPTTTHEETRKLVRFSNCEVVGALGLAGCVNLAMVALAAAVFHASGHRDVATIDDAYRTLGPLLGVSAGVVFMIALLASGFASSVVGTMAGQVIMQDFLRFRMPLWIRRLVTMLPPFAVVGFGFDPTRSLVLSQVVLSLILPVPMVALVVVCGRRDIMGPFKTGPVFHAVLIVTTAVVIILNLVLVAQIFGFG